MTSASAMFNPAIIHAMIFPSIKTLVDVVGGQGAFLAAILQANLHLNDILMVQSVIEPRNSPNLSRFTDLETLLVTVGGHERYAAEFEPQGYSFPAFCPLNARRVLSKPLSPRKAPAKAITISAEGALSDQSFA